MRALLLLAACGLLLCGCGSTAHSAARPPRLGIVFEHRIGPISFGEPKDRVDAALGPGVSKDPNGRRGASAYVFYPRADLYVGYFPAKDALRAAAIITLSPRYKTATGAGVGTTLEQLRTIANVTCAGDGFKHGVLADPSSNPGECNHHEPGTGDGDQVYTYFTLDFTTKRVTQVAVAIAVS